MLIKSAFRAKNSGEHFRATMALLFFVVVFFMFSVNFLFSDEIIH